MSQGLPAAFRIGASLPSGVPAYRQDTIHNSTTQNEFHPDQTVKIPLNTGTTGAFWNTSTTRLISNVRIANANPFADFDSFTRGGMAKLIREIAFTVNGVDVEVNRNYAAVVELEMIRYGRNTDPFYMTFINEWDVGGGHAGDLHIMLVKPCMVNASGAPWLLGTSETSTDPYDTKQRSIAVGPHHRTAIRHAAAGTAFAMFSQNSVMGEASYPVRGNALTTATLMNIPTGLSVNGAGTAIAYHNESSQNGWGPLTSGSSGAPILWPYAQPYHEERLAQRVKANRQGRTPLPDVSRYFANVKYMPIMPVPKFNTPDHYIGGQAAMPASGAITAPTGEAPTLQIRSCLELYLGTIGVLAKSAFPALAVGAGRAELSIRLETARRFFQLTMDPCRRVPGTVRDWAPYFGAAGTSRPIDSSATMAKLGRFSGGEMVFHTQERAPHTASDDGGSTQLYALTCLKDSVCIGKYPTPPSDVLACLSYTVSNAGTPVYGVEDASTYVTDGSRSVRTLATTRAQILTAAIPTKQEAMPKNPFAPPRPQYIPVAEPWVARHAANTVETHVAVSEKNVCFGTYMRYSHPQSARTTSGTKQSVSADQYLYEIPNFTCNGFAVCVDEILFNDAITSSILSAGMAGNAVVETTVLVETIVQLPKNASQNILIPLTGASLSDVCLAFQHPDELQGPNAAIYSASNFINPFALLERRTVELNGFTNTYPEVKTAFENTGDMGINLQFQLGSEMMPRRPLNDFMQFSEFISKGDQVFRGAGDHGNYSHMSGHACQLDYFAEYIGQLNSSKFTSSRGPTAGFFAPHCPADMLGDQTLTNNIYLYNTSPTTDGDANLPYIGGSALPMRTVFEPLQGTFHISLNLETFMGQSAKIRSGASIVNSQFFVKFDKAYQCGAAALQMIAYARAHATMVFERGGGIQLIR